MFVINLLFKKFSLHLPEVELKKVSRINISKYCDNNANKYWTLTHIYTAQETQVGWWMKTLSQHCIDPERDYILLVALAISTSWSELLYGGRSAPEG